MGFFSYLFWGGLAAYGVHKTRESNEEQRQKDAEKIQKETKRKSCVYQFDDGISKDDFKNIAISCAKKIKRIETVRVYGLSVKCTVSSQSGISSWDFTLDYNDYGKLTGTCYSRTDNCDSSIPERLRELITEKLEPYIEVSVQKEKEREEKARKERLEQERQMAKEQQESKRIRREKIKAFFFNGKRMVTNFSSKDFKGQHWETVVKQIEKRGFLNLIIKPIYDVYIENMHILGEVERIYIRENESIERDMMLQYDTEIIVEYHDKLRIKPPLSSNKFKNISYIEVVKILKNAGYTNIEVISLKDLTTGWISKNESVKEVVINGDSKFKDSQLFVYDDKIKIYYHSFKRE